MRNLKWYYLLAFVLGGLAVVAIVYVLLRATGVIYKLTPSDSKWVEYDA